MPVPVYFASAKQSRIRAEETLPAKLDVIVERLGIADRVKGKSVAIKMHLGSKIGYSTIHPVFVRRLVQMIQDAGGRPFVADTSGAVLSAHERGYARETIGCPAVPCAGIDERQYEVFHHPFKNITQWKMGRLLMDADFVIGFAHIKGHPSCSYGGAIKNFALGNAIAETRSAMHRTVHFDKYWFPERLPSSASPDKLMSLCLVEGLVPDRDNPKDLHIHFENCNQCLECEDLSGGALEIRPGNFHTFQEACAISTMHTFSRFAPEDRAFINVATQITPVCDCFGFTGMSILPDIGLFASNDLIAIEQATLDELAKYQIIEENLPLSVIPQRQPGLHPLQVIHGQYKDPYKVLEYGEKLGLGERGYELSDVMPLESNERKTTESDMRVDARNL